ncbi:uncharacterized protein LOC141858333 isoform X2 [Brevipalpus obovatus]
MVNTCINSSPVNVNNVQDESIERCNVSNYQEWREMMIQNHEIKLKTPKVPVRSSSSAVSNNNNNNSKRRQDKGKSMEEFVAMDAQSKAAYVKDQLDSVGKMYFDKVIKAYEMSKENAKRQEQINITLIQELKNQFESNRLSMVRYRQLLHDIADGRIPERS